MANLRQLSGYAALLRQGGLSTHSPLIWVWKVAQSRALLSRSVLSPQPSAMGGAAMKTQLFWHFPPTQNSLWKAFTKLIQFWVDQNCIFQQRKYLSPSRGELNPSVVLSSHRPRKDIILKFPWSIQTQTSSGTAWAIQNTFKNNYKTLSALVSFMLWACQHFKVFCPPSPTE